MDIYKRLEELGLKLPVLPKPLASYEPATVYQNIVFTSGQLPIVNQELKYRGKVGKDLTVEEAKEAAKICILNCLAAVHNVLGDLNKVEKVIKVTGFVNSSPDFIHQPAVIEGASTLLIDLFGETGKHARSAVGVAALPNDVAVEIEIMISIKSSY
ncbi:MAG: RidA family protein [Epulopiscium sp.]|nr:RidA family protein [Candidatus Epulonipiscium sp.]